MVDRQSLRTGATVVLAVVLVASLGAVAYLAVTPQQVTDPYFEFYLLGPGGMASDYPTNLTVGESGTVIVGLVNHEGEEVTYTVDVVARNESLASRSVTLAHEESWEEELSFSLSTPGRTRVRFLLYKGSEPTGQPVESLRLWVTVSSRA